MGDPTDHFRGGGRDDDDAAELAAMGIITVGDLLTTAARAVGACFPTFLVIVVVILLPAIALNVAAQEWVLHGLARFAEDPYSMDPAQAVDFAMLSSGAVIGAIVAQTMFGFVAQASLMYATVEFMAGRRAGIGESLAGGFGSILTVLALAVLNTLAITLGLFACIVPGIVIACVLIASVPSAVVERLGPIEAMQRSADLTSGHRATIFLALLALGLVWFSFSCSLNMGIGVIQTDDSVLQPLPIRVISYASDWGIRIVFTIFNSALAAVFYARARGVRDGVDADAIAREFE